jgi:putative ABC transport system permease protein
MKLIENIMSDALYALRSLVRTPGFTAIAIATLMLGIGANVAIFSVVRAVLLEPLPYPQPDELVSVWGGSHAEYVGLRDRTTLFDAVGAYRPGVQLNLSGTLEPVRLTGAAVTGELFNALRIQPMIGRAIEPGEERPGTEPVVVLSHGVWRDRFGADEGIVGRVIEVEGARHTVVGVMPATFAFPAETQLWIPLSIDEAIRGQHWGVYGLSVVGRLKPDVTAEQGRAEVRAIAARLRIENPVWTPAEEQYVAGVDVVPLQQQLVTSSRSLLLLLSGAAGLVLLIACANVANLLLVRGAAREREIAVRAALGAGRGRLVRQLITESLLLSLAGTLAGVALAFAAGRALISVLPPEVTRLGDAVIDTGVLLFSMMLALTTALAFGLAPALRLVNPSLRDSLVAGGRSTGSGDRPRLASALVSAEVALAIVLIVGATLLVRSLWELQRVDPGFRTDQVVSARVSLPAARYGLEQRHVFWTQLLDQLRMNPAVAEAATTSDLPVNQPPGTAMEIEGYNSAGGALDVMLSSQVSETYLDVMGIPLLRGRRFTNADQRGSMLVAYVDETAVDRFWNGRDPIGAQIRYPWGGEWLTVVGVVGAVKGRGLAADAEPTVHVPLAQTPTPNPTALAIAMASEMVVIRATDASQAVAALRSTVARLAPDAPVSDVRTLEERLAGSIAGPRSALTLLGAFAAVALMLGAVGTYGVMAWVTTRRTRELALRLALGAEPAHVIALVTRQGAILAIVGAAIGIVIAFGLTNLLRGMLFGVSARDPLTFALVPTLLVAVTVLASWIPARRAAALNPMAALREE